jgi:hypothetical protein
MINDFNDFCTWMYVVVDDIWLKIAPFFKRPGSAPECPDIELLAMALIGECRGNSQEAGSPNLSRSVQEPHRRPSAQI